MPPFIDPSRVSQVGKTQLGAPDRPPPAAETWSKKRPSESSQEDLPTFLTGANRDAAMALGSTRRGWGGAPASVTPENGNRDVNGNDGSQNPALSIKGAAASASGSKSTSASVEPPHKKRRVSEHGDHPSHPIRPSAPSNGTLTTPPPHLSPTIAISNNSRKRSSSTKSLNHPSMAIESTINMPSLGYALYRLSDSPLKQKDFVAVKTEDGQAPPSSQSATQGGTGPTIDAMWEETTCFDFILNIFSPTMDEAHMTRHSSSSTPRAKSRPSTSQPRTGEFILQPSSSEPASGLPSMSRSNGEGGNAILLPLEAVEEVQLISSSMDEVGIGITFRGDKVEDQILPTRYGRSLRYPFQLHIFANVLHPNYSISVLKNVRAFLTKMKNRKREMEGKSIEIVKHTTIFEVLPSLETFNDDETWKEFPSPKTHMPVSSFNPNSNDPPTILTPSNSPAQIIKPSSRPTPTPGPGVGLGLVPPLPPPNDAAPLDHWVSKDPIQTSWRYQYLLHQYWVIGAIDPSSKVNPPRFTEDELSILLYSPRKDLPLPPSRGTTLANGPGSRQPRSHESAALRLLYPNEVLPPSSVDEILDGGLGKSFANYFKMVCKLADMREEVDISIPGKLSAWKNLIATLERRLREGNSFDPVRSQLGLVRSLTNDPAFRHEFFYSPEGKLKNLGEDHNLETIIGPGPYRRLRISFGDPVYAGFEPKKWRKLP